MTNKNFLTSPAREALLQGGLEDVESRIEQTQERIAIMQAILHTLEAEREGIQDRLYEVQRLRREEQS